MNLVSEVSSPKKNLSKSLFMMGEQCPKSLWIYKNLPNEKGIVDEKQEGNFLFGKEIGKKAQNLFPKGVDLFAVKESFSHHLYLTQQYLKKDYVTLFEAAFQYDSIFILADILVKIGNSYELYEVKSSTQIKRYHYKDISLQYYVLNKLNIPIKKAGIIYVNSHYNRATTLDIKRLFKKKFVLTKIKTYQKKIHNSVQKLREIIKLRSAPSIDIGTYCNKPYPCRYKHLCWKNIPEYSVFNLINLSKEKKFSYYKKGILTFDTIYKKNLPLSKKQHIQLNTCSSSQNLYIERDAILNFLSTLIFPLYIIDFEGIQYPIPRFSKSHPYEQIPFSFSLRKCTDFDNHDHHNYFHPIQFGDPRPTLFKKLYPLLPVDHGSIIVFGGSYEIAMLKKVRHYIHNISPNHWGEHIPIIDLLHPFESFHIYHKKMNGKLSLKSIATALTLTDQKEGAIHNGFHASYNYYLTKNLDPNSEEMLEKQKSLIHYNELDTLMILQIIKKLHKLSTTSL